MNDVYDVYVYTFVQARSALSTSDDARLRAICAEVATRNGIESAVSLLAMSDAEQGLEPRRRGALLWMVRDRRCEEDPAQCPIQVPEGPRRASAGIPES